MTQPRRAADPRTKSARRFAAPIPGARPRRTVSPRAPLAVAALLASALAHAAPAIQITSPQDQAFVNPGGGAPEPVEVTYQVTGNTCTGFRSSFSIVPYVNGAPVACFGVGCACDGTTESCNNITRTITLDGNDFPGCLNSIQIEMSPRPFCSPLCVSPCSSPIRSNTVQVWQSAHRDCTGSEECTSGKGEIGNPVDVATGRMYHEATDLRVAGPRAIAFVRRYDSSSTYAGPMGYGWQHSYLMRIEAAGTGRQVFVDAAGRRIYFVRDAVGAWQENRIDHLVLTAPGSPTWRVTDKHQTRYEFDASGRLTQIVDRNSNTTALAYTGSNLTGITDAFGRSVALAYDGSGRVQTLTAGPRTVSYTYDGLGNLTRVDHPDGSFVTYEYSDPGDVHNLTAARDALGRLIESHTYDGLDRVIQTESEGGNYAYTLVYDTATQTTVTNSRGVDTVYAHDPFGGLVTAASGPGCTSCGGGGTSTAMTYDRFLNLTERVDGRGTHTQMTYDAKGNLLTRKEAVGTPVERTWTFTYNPTFNFVATVTIPSVGSCGSPNRVLTNSYNGTGDRTQEQVAGCNGSSPFTYTTIYTYDAHGQLRTANRPRTDVSDVTTYDYYADGDADPNRRARLSAVTNALGQASSYNGYDLFGNLGSVVDANGVETTFTYDARDRELERRIHGAVPADDVVTVNVYDAVGNLDLVKLPNCVAAACPFSLDYGYDGVNRLVRIEDPLGNKLVYAYDTEGNRTREENRDGADVVRRFTNFAYDDFNRLEYVYHNAIVPEDPGSVYTKYVYDGNGNRTSERDPEGHVATFTYDALDRLATVTQTAGADTLLTSYAYDIQDNLLSVTDPEGLLTTYTNGDMGWRLGAVSPDTGTTTYVYDPAGNLTQTMDANGVVVTRTYDALGRPLTASYPDAGQNVSWSYDSGAVTFGIGRRTGMTDPSGTTVYAYDRRGLLLKEEKTIAAATFATEYAYDKTGNLTRILYPSEDPALRRGQADFSYDAADRVVGITAKVDWAPAAVASGIAYAPFGPRTAALFGNALAETRTYGTRYELGDWTVGGVLSYAHAWDDDLSLTGRIDNLDAANDRTFGYDAVHRLTQAAGPWGPATGCAGGATYTYDRNGNRLCKGEDATATTYAYTAGTNRLASSSGGEVATYGYDANGNTTGDGTRSYEYSDADRLAAVDGGATATYVYDGEGRRVRKIVGAATTDFFYDPQGRLLTEMVRGAGAGRDYVYLEGAPIARVDWTTEQGLGSVLQVSKASPNVHLDWSAYPVGGNEYVVRRKQVVDPGDRSFDGSTVVATLSDPVQTYDDPVLGDGNDYDYRVLREAADDTLLFYHTDHLGTPIAMTDGAGALAWRAEHRPFGGDLSLPVEIVMNNLRFLGQYLDAETRLHQNWHRNYSPPAGRYTTPDPLDLAGGVNLYLYVQANPIAYVDPHGLLAYKSGVPKAKPGLEKLLLCIETCLGREMTVTSTHEPTPVHPPGSTHRRGEAADLRYLTGLSDKFLCCATECSAGFALDEALHPSRRSTAPHFHVQIPPGRAGGRGDLFPPGPLDCDRQLCLAAEPDSTPIGED